MKNKKKKKKKNYKKGFKKGYMFINQMHLGKDRMDEITELKKLENSNEQKTYLIPDSDRLKHEKIRKMGNQESVSHIRLICNFGNLNLELYGNKAPVATHNFIKLCESGSYDGMKFHRLIKGFMIQGGKTKSGKSIWGCQFHDEYHPSLKHDSRGILSMANAGPGTNGSQFFVLFGLAPHLDGKHTVFGKVVGGLNMLDLIENIQTDDKDFPMKNIVVLRTKVYSDPFRNL